LFFATLNCPIEADSLDKRKRGFRGDGYGTHRGIDYLMRYKSYFKNPDAFLEKLNQTVPFLNGGLFECLDDKFNNIYIDGFSDQMTKGEQLIVPDYLFFGVEEETDLSDIVGIKDKKYKQAAVKGLINILKSYKFTITENTPIEEDVALDPELLGKVFENLLASYNPETKTTARKQTGSFYTPREIVNYMVDESLIAYLKNAISPDSYREGGLDDETLDKELHVLTSFDNKVPFADNPKLQREIITALSTCTILDPACGSGAFPMGILQKMVHILQKLDPDNKVWREVQEEKAKKEAAEAIVLENKDDRDERLKEISEAFDQSINDPDYARKLFLIENCIYGVDIQPIATQISKLRFFISLVVEQKVNAEKDNFGIRPLPNLETKFVAANTLIGIEKPKLGDQLNLYSTEGLKALETKLKKVRSKLFSAKSKETKLKYREEDKVLRNQIAEELEKSGWKSDTAQKLAGWDPYDQNASSSFFDSEWMFDIKDGFDVVIGNPPYVSVKGISSENKKIFSQIFETGKGRFNLFTLFIEKAINILEKNGVLTFIIPEGILSNIEYIHSRKYILDSGNLNVISLFSERVFEAAVDTCVVSFIKNNTFQDIKIYQDAKDLTHSISKQEIYESPNLVIPVQSQGNDKIIIESFMSKSFDDLSDLIELQQGIIYSGQAKEDVFSNEAINSNYKKSLDGRDISKWKINWNQKTENKYINYTSKLHRPREERLFISKPKIVFPRKANSIYCAIDLDSHYALNTAYVVLIKNNKCSYSYLASWLNSKLVNFVYSKLYFGWQITIPALMTMKIKSPSSSVSKLFDFLVFSSPVKFDQIIDSLILDYYFHDHMKERGIDVLEYVERDIDEVMQGREFEKLSDTEKEQVIEALHAKWSHPDNEIRNRIKLFAVRSPEILKPIMES
jgi:adenine-specific DNA methylase